MSNDECWRHCGIKMYIRMSSPKRVYGSQYIMKEVNILSCEEICYSLQIQNGLMKNLRILNLGLYYLYSMSKFYLLETQLFHLQKKSLWYGMEIMCGKGLKHSRPLPINDSYFYLFSKNVNRFTVTRQGWGR